MDIILIFFVISLFITIFYLYKLLSDVKFNYITVCNENSFLKSKIEDLKTYKNDVSRTFEILNNDLKIINEELKKPNREEQITQTTTETLNEQVIDEFADQILNNVSRYLVQLSN